MCWFRGRNAYNRLNRASLTNDTPQLDGMLAGNESTTPKLTLECICVLVVVAQFSQYILYIFLINESRIVEWLTKG